MCPKKFFFKTIINHVVRFSNRLLKFKTTESDINEAVKLKLVTISLRRLYILSLAVCIQEAVILAFDFTKGENNIYGQWFHTSCVALIIFNLIMLIPVSYVLKYKKSSLVTLKIVNLIYWAGFSAIMINFILMDLLAEFSFLNYLLLLMLLSSYAIFNSIEWFATAGLLMLSLIILIYIFQINRIYLYYIIVLFLIHGLLSKTLYSSYINIYSSRHTLELDNECLRKQCNTDPLTGLLNRRGFEIKANELWGNCKSSGRCVSAVFIDVDLFKCYNDYYGHQQGDECLARIARCISDISEGENILVSRYGGEEFLLLLDGLSSEEAVELASSIKNRVEQLKIISPTNAVSEYLTVSIGLSTAVPSDIIAISDLLKQTDSHLYTAKNNGRNMLVYDK